MRKYLKIIAIAAMVAVMTPVAGQAANNAKIKATCMEMANGIATAMAQTGGTRSKEILAAFGEGMKKAGGTVTWTDTELLWIMPVEGNPTTQINIYTGIREVRVMAKGAGIVETASAKY